MVDIDLPPMQYSDAEALTQFFENLNGMVNTFDLDLSEVFPHDSSASSVTLRLSSPDIFWSAEDASKFGFTFRAEEVL